MTLPMNPTPVYTCTVPSSKKEIKYRPFLVRDEKALLVAQQSEDPVVMLDTMKEVIKSCVKTPIDVESLALFDVEYLMIQLRMVSVGEHTDIVFQCDDDHGEDNEKARSTVRIDLRDVKVEFPEGHTKTIKLFGDVGVVMKYPSLDTIKKLEASDENNLDQMFGVVIDCIDYIFDNDQVYPAKDVDSSELMTFLNNLTPDQFNKVQEFFRTMPSLKVWVDYKCPVCGKDHHKYMEGLHSFF